MEFELLFRFLPPENRVQTRYVPEDGPIFIFVLFYKGWNILGKSNS